MTFSKPFVFDLTEATLFGSGQKNLLAIKVVRNSLINEIGLGGLLRPSFLFTGPRVENPVDTNAPQQRVLPGGELGGVE